VKPVIEERELKSFAQPPVCRIMVAAEPGIH
jgi:hypothetical protein